MKCAILLFNILTHCCPVVLSILMLFLFGASAIVASYKISFNFWKEFGDLLKNEKTEKANFIILGKYLTFTVLGFLAVLSLVIIGIIILSIHLSNVGL